MRRTMLEVDRADGPDGFARQVAKSFKQTTQRILEEVLSAKQRDQWHELIGPAFTGTLPKGPPNPFPPGPFPTR